MSAHLVIFDSEANCDCCGGCSQIGLLAQQTFGADRLRVTTVQVLGRRSAGPEPDMVVLRASTGARLIDVLRPVREVWRATPVVAAVCNSHHDAAELLESFQAASPRSSEEG